jgi:hypothetical protein
MAVIERSAAEIPDSFSTHQWIGIPGTGHYPADTCFYDGICAWWLLSVMTAGFQRYIDRGAFWRLAAGSQRIPLRVRFSIFFMVSLTNNTAIFYDHCPNYRIWRCIAVPLLRQLNGYGHIFFVFTVILCFFQTFASSFSFRNA